MEWFALVRGWVPQQVPECRPSTRLALLLGFTLGASGMQSRYSSWNQATGLLPGDSWPQGKRALSHLGQLAEFRAPLSTPLVCVPFTAAVFFTGFQYSHL